MTTDIDMKWICIMVICCIFMTAGERDFLDASVDLLDRIHPEPCSTTKSLLGEDV